MFRAALLAAVWAGASYASAQTLGVDSVWVETYHVWDSIATNGDPLVTYRIWVDLAPGYRMQVVYGDHRHDLEVSTSTEFVNDAANSVKYVHLLPVAALNEGYGALDSWFTMGAGSAGHWAVPLHLDGDGSVLRYPPYAPSVKRRDSAPSLCRRDGLLASDSVPAVVNWRFEPGYLEAVRGSVIHTMDGAWAVLGGVSAPTEDGHILIAQLTTSGQLSFRLNIQVADANRVALKYVHSEPADGEVVLPSLRYGRDRR